MNNIKKVAFCLLFMVLSPLFGEKGYVHEFDLSGQQKQELQDAYNTLGVKTTATDSELKKALDKKTSTIALTQSAKSKNAYVKEAYELIKKRRTEEAASMKDAKDSKDYATLGIKSTATDSEIRTAYRKLALKNHPDKGGNEEEFKKISAAYERIASSRNFR